ncbi:type VI secretion system baseplate subunit TssG [Flocculibacter collagenilyticus]|uniref:type VI secretion system baseplate subunit TssG n=1 Tax=Flocculibacter collagenilyticus TaxID=2744479 RepID=UPI0018F5ECAD|nr:type VI secretion system baseplate subunit TssG [Flocculibacter collagenilyticus]
MQPNWEKLPDSIEQLIQAPWKFSFYKAISLLESHWAEKGELAAGLSSRVLITNYEGLGFPASDLRQCELLSGKRGVIKLATSYLGLYGVDSPMPHYLLELTQQDEKEAQRTRAFLDLFNHSLYCLLYQTWKKSQLNLKGLGSNQFDQLLNVILAESKQRKVSSGVASLKQVSAAGLQELLRQELAINEVWVLDNQPNWITIDTASQLGDESSMVLGNSIILGNRALVSGGQVTLKIGPLTPEQANDLEPGSPGGANLCRLMQSQLSADVPWHCSIKINQPARPAQYMGDPMIMLGYTSFLGDAKSTIETKSFTQSQYATLAA